MFLEKIKSSIYFILIIILLFAHSSYYVQYNNNAIFNVSIPEWLKESNETVPFHLSDLNVLDMQYKKSNLAEYVITQYDLDHQYAYALLNTVHQNSMHYNIPVDLILGVIERESSFRHDAKSNAGAKGLMQIIPKWHMEKIKKNGGSTEMLLDPHFNIKIGTQILKEYIDQSKGNLTLALAKYNGSVGMNTDYSPKVIKSQQKYKKIMTSKL